MKLTIYSVYPAGRKWGEWLGTFTSEELIGMENYHDSQWYAGEGRFLTLIHYGAQLSDSDSQSALEIERKWMELPHSIRERVFWLIYSGGGYWSLSSEQANIHYFRYPVGRTFINDDDKLRFTELCRMLKEDDDVVPSQLWESVYPKENLHAATLLAILSAEAIVDISPAVAELLAEGDTLRLAHREFTARVKPPATPADLNAWLDALDRHDYALVRNELRNVLGAAPD